MSSLQPRAHQHTHRVFNVSTTTTLGFESPKRARAAPHCKERTSCPNTSGRASDRKRLPKQRPLQFLPPCLFCSAALWRKRVDLRCDASQELVNVRETEQESRNSPTFPFSFTRLVDARPPAGNENLSQLALEGHVRGLNGLEAGPASVARAGPVRTRTLVFFPLTRLLKRPIVRLEGVKIQREREKKKKTCFAEWWHCRVGALQTCWFAEDGTCVIFPVHMCHVLQCHHCICVHFRRALEFQAKTVFSHLSSPRVAPTCTLRTLTTLAAELNYCSFLVIYELQLVRAIQLRKRACLIRAVAKREEIYLRPSDPFSIDSYWPHGIISCCFGVKLA